MAPRILLPLPGQKYPWDNMKNAQVRFPSPVHYTYVVFSLLPQRPRSAHPADRKDGTAQYTPSARPGRPHPAFDKCCGCVFSQC